MWRDDLHTDTAHNGILWPGPAPRPQFSRNPGMVVMSTPRNYAPLGMDPFDTRTWTRPVTDTRGMFGRLHEDTAKAARG